MGVVGVGVVVGVVVGVEWVAKCYNTGTYEIKKDCPIKADDK